MKLTSVPDEHPLKKFALKHAAISHIVEEHFYAYYSRKPVAERTDEFVAKIYGYNVSAMVSELFNGWLKNTPDTPEAKILLAHKYAWAEYLIGSYHVRITRDQPTGSTNRSAAFNHGANTLGYYQDSLFEEDDFGQNLVYERTATNVYFQAIPDDVGGLSSYSFYSARQKHDGAFIVSISLEEILEARHQIQNENPSWLNLLESQLPLETTDPKKQTPPASPQEDAQDYGKIQPTKPAPSKTAQENAGAEEANG